jgi:Na+/proline symporter
VLAGFSAQFTWIDWLVVVAYLAGTTWLGARMAGKQQTIRDFFLGGRKLPWMAVSGSIIATEISALTFVSVPFLVFRDGGNFTYLQLGVFGSFFARIVVGYWLVPAYYQREIYSPYDYMQHQLGGYVRPMITALFMLGSMLGQSARIYLTGQVLVVVLHDQLTWLSAQLGLDPLAWAILIIAGVSLVWTLLGGMTTVVWTDVVLFAAFVVGALVALGVIIASLDGGVAEMVRAGLNAPGCGPYGKFTFFNFANDPSDDLTIWAAVIASTWGGVGSYGIDQLLVQRMFCCKGPREARWAIIGSAVSQLVTITVMLVGVGLYAYYQTHTMSPEGAALFAEKGDRVLPIFTVEVVPLGLKGVIIAAIIAAAISTVMGVLTALAQTVQSAYYNPWRERRLAARGIRIRLAESLDQDAPGPAEQAEHVRSVAVGRALIVFWAVVLSLLAYFAQYAAAYYPTILQLGLAMAQYVIGALIAGFALAFLRLGIDGRGFLYSGPLSVMCIFALVWHQPWAWWTCVAFAVIWMGLWFSRTGARALGEELRGTLAILAGAALLLVCNHYGVLPGPPATKGTTIAWPWLGPIGSVVAFIWGYLLARSRTVGT